MLFFILFSIPVNLGVLNNICLFKLITGKECWNCGMTRAFLSIMHLNFGEAFKYNNKAIIAFPLTIILYIYSWYKYIVKKDWWKIWAKKEIPFFSTLLYGLYVVLIIIGIVKSNNEDDPELPVVWQIAKSIFDKKIEE